MYFTIRRIPVCRIWANIYCDTQLQCNDTLVISIQFALYFKTVCYPNPVAKYERKNRTSSKKVNHRRTFLATYSTHHASVIAKCNHVPHIFFLFNSKFLINIFCGEAVVVCTVTAAIHHNRMPSSFHFLPYANQRDRCRNVTQSLNLCAEAKAKTIATVSIPSIQQRSMKLWTF